MRIGNVEVSRGQRISINVPVARLYTHAEMNLPVHVVRGKRDGPSLLVCAAIHGDEVLGVEIIRRLLRQKALERLRGSLIAVPVVNVYGFDICSRYSPDRRDLNRCFPGVGDGSLTSRLARLFLEEVASAATHIVDLHTGANHRTNLPQIRGYLEDQTVGAMARAFGAPVILDAELRDGSLRQAAQKKGIPTIVYEGGEALRFDEVAIRVGLRGVLSVMRELGMLSRVKPKRKGTVGVPLVARRTNWVRTPISGILTRRCKLGTIVEKGQPLGFVGDPYGEADRPILAPASGVVIGALELPLVHQGDALFHLAQLEESDDVVADTLDLALSDLVPSSGRAEPEEIMNKEWTPGG